MENAAGLAVQGSTPDRGTPPAEVAIVGMACVMPGAPDLEAFWANVVDGVDSVTEVPTSRWNPDLHFDPDSGAARSDDPMSISKWGGFIPDVGFDALAWGIPPASLASIDPAQLLALKVAADALDDAGYDGNPRARTGSPGRAGTAETGSRELDRDRTSLVYATGSGGATELPAGLALRLLLRSHRAGKLPAELDAFLPRLTEDGLPGVLTSVIAGRVANRLDLGGKNFTVDSACASVLVALDLAFNELVAGTSDTVLCGGVDLHNGAQDYVSFTAAGALSPSGRCRSFDKDADGMTLAEGAGCIVLKRLDDAQRDGNRIYAVVKGVAGSSDGRHLGLTAPLKEGQVKAVQRAYAAAGVSPAAIGLVEAHGTGTPAGDRTELATMTDTFTAAGASPRSIVIGTVKSNVGHVKCAAGIASLIKAAKATYHGVLPPTLHITEPNEVWDPETSPFDFLDRPRPWLEDERLVGVSAFGFGGTNFHAVLGNHHSPGNEPARHLARPAPPTSGRPHWPAELFMFRAPSRAELDQRLTQLSGRLATELDGAVQADRWRLRDIAAAESSSGEGPVRMALVAGSLHELAAKVAAARQGRAGDETRGAPPAGGGGGDTAFAELAGGGIYWAAEPSSTDDGASTGEEPQVAFVFAEPSQARIGMGAEVLTAFPRQRGAARNASGWGPIMFPPQAFGDDRTQHEDAFATIAERATAIMSTTMERILVALGITPACRVAPHDQLGDEVRNLASDGIRIFVEVGPGRSQTERVSEALADVPHLAVVTDQPEAHGLVSLLHALAQLAVAGVSIDSEAFYASRSSDADRWLQPDKAPNWIVNGHYARTATGGSLPNGLHPAHDAPQVHVTSGPTGSSPERAGAATGNGATGNGAAADDPAGLGGLAAGDLAAITEYLQLVNSIIATGAELLRAPGNTETGLQAQSSVMPQAQGTTGLEAHDGTEHPGAVDAGRWS